MRKQVDHLQRQLYGSSSTMRSWGVAQYGLEAAMPKGSTGKSLAELENMDIREERLYKRLIKYEEQVYAIEMAGDLLDDEKDRVIYDCLLDGMSYRAIADQLGITRNQAKEAKKAILSTLSQKSQFVSLLKLEKSLV
ncbi:sigma-70 family RNA polymerase sigma factor [Neobacillus sp. M.A.Huq-85]